MYLNDVGTRKWLHFFPSQAFRYCGLFQKQYLWKNLGNWNSEQLILGYFGILLTVNTFYFMFHLLSSTAKVHATDYSNISATGFWDPFDMDWNYHAFNVIHFYHRYFHLTHPRFSPFPDPFSLKYRTQVVTLVLQKAPKYLVSMDGVQTMHPSPSPPSQLTKLKTKQYSFEWKKFFFFFFTVRRNVWRMLFSRGGH